MSLEAQSKKIGMLRKENIDLVETIACLAALPKVIRKSEGGNLIEP